MLAISSHGWISAVIKDVGLIFKKVFHSKNLFYLLAKTLSILRSEGLNGIRIRLLPHANITVPEYQRWIALHEGLDLECRAFIRLKIDSLDGPPLLSVLLPTCDSNIVWLKEAIDSVQKQIYQNWELCIADDASRNPEVKSLLLEYSQQDSRIKIIYCQERRGISQTANTALGIASGQWIALLDHDDLILLESYSNGINQYLQEKQSYTIEYNMLYLQHLFHKTSIDVTNPIDDDDNVEKN